tara:strand:+ start:297 stop:491 length:195 start_codon:yes stop_codon:yes gene_type:complete
MSEVYRNTRMNQVATGCMENMEHLKEMQCQIDLLNRQLLELSNQVGFLLEVNKSLYIEKKRNVI